MSNLKTGLSTLDLEMIKFIGMLTELSRKSTWRPVGFSEVVDPSSYYEGIVYDDSDCDVHGDKEYYPVVDDMLVDENHHDIISQYSDLFTGVDVHYVKDLEKACWWVEVHIYGDFFINVHDGYWEVV